MSIMSNTYISRNVYCIQKENILGPGNDTDTRGYRTALLKKLTFIAIYTGLGKFCCMSNSYSRIVLCEVCYLNMSRNINHTAVKHPYQHSAHRC